MNLIGFRRQNPTGDVFLLVEGSPLEQPYSICIPSTYPLLDSIYEELITPTEDVILFFHIPTAQKEE